MKSVLVTGASGFIGRHVLKELSNEFSEVYALYHSNKPSLNQKNIKWYKVDLLDEMMVKDLIESTKPSHLLHLAWYAEPGKYGTSPVNIDWMMSGIKLVRQFRDNGGMRVVCAGTCFEYDLNYGFLSESKTPRNPGLIYGVCKKTLSDIIENYAQLSGLSSAWGHIFYLYGSHEHPGRLVSSVIRSLLQNQPAECSSGLQKKDFLHVQDVANAFVKILVSDIEGRVNIGSGDALSVRNLVLKIGEILNRSELIKLGVLPDRENEPPLILADNRRLTNEIRWKPEYNLEKGLNKTIEWWKRELI